MYLTLAFVCDVCGDDNDARVQACLDENDILYQFQRAPRAVHVYVPALDIVVDDFQYADPLDVFVCELRLCVSILAICDLVLTIACYDVL